jgi:type II secretory pathway component PulF
MIAAARRGEESKSSDMAELMGSHTEIDRLTTGEAAELSTRIADLTGAGLPLSQGLRALGAELPRGRLRRSMNELAQTLEMGVPLDQAVEAEGKRVPPHLRGLVVAGMRTGRLGDLLSRFSAFSQIGTELKRALWLSLAYPALTVTVASALFIFVCVVLITQFEAIYADFGIPLPGITVALIAIARIVRSVWIPLIFLGGGSLVAWVAARVFLTRSARRSLAGRLPLLGPVWRATSLAEFCHLLALLLESGLPLPEALRLTGQGVQDAEFDVSCGVVAQRVESGRSLAQAMGERRLFPAGLPRLLLWAEGQKSLTDVLHIAGSIFEARARSQATFVGWVMTVLCLFPVLSIVLVVPALFIPLFTLISKLSG